MSQRCSWNQKAGGGGWGEGAAPPPKAERQYMTIPLFTGNATCKNIFIYIYIYTHAEKCNKHVARNKKREGGLGGRPPKAE